MINVISPLTIIPYLVLKPLFLSLSNIVVVIPDPIILLRTAIIKITENKIIIPETYQNDNIEPLNSTIGLSKKDITPPNANRPKIILPITKSIISEIPKCLQILPNIIEGITKTKISN